MRQRRRRAFRAEHKLFLDGMACQSMQNSLEVLEILKPVKIRFLALCMMVLDFSQTANLVCVKFYLST